MAQPGANKIPTCFASCSIGHRPEHTLPLKLKAISEAGFDAIELSMSDILAYGKQIHGRDIDPKDYETLAGVAKDIKRWVDEQGLEILMLQPFANFEGWPKGSPERKDAFVRARGWMRIMEAAGTDMLQIGSTDAKNTSSSQTAMAADLAELADEMAPKGFRIAYENWCWATHARTWKDVWEVVRKANRPNLGLCLDTFQSAGGEWGDPTTATGIREDKPRDQLDSDWKASCDELARTVPPEKIFLLQISDAYRLAPRPLDATPDARSRWSHDYRPLPYDGGYMPIEDFTRAVLRTGFRGWMSVEVFDGRGPEKYRDLGPYAQKAKQCVDRLLQEGSN